MVVEAKNRRQIISAFFILASVPTAWFFYEALAPHAKSAAEVLPVTEIKSTGESLPMDFAIPWGNEAQGKEDSTTANDAKRDSGAVQAAVPANFPKITSTDWRLLLVGPDHPLAKENEINSDQLVEVAPGEKLDKRIVADYQKMKAEAKQAGVVITEISGYRSIADQQVVFNEKFQRMKAQGMTDEEAKAATMTDMTEPGYSEHHTGLAMDVVDEAWLASDPTWTLSEDYGKTVGGKWLAEHAKEYGFIIRYPANKTDLTKITYEPWHLRYVGREVAEYMSQEDLCLEEFVQEVKKWGAYDSQTLSQEN